MPVRRSSYPMILFALAVLASVFAAPRAHADDERISGPYRISASFVEKPLYALERNTLLVRVSAADTGAPVAGLESVLRVRVSVPHQASETLAILPVEGQPGDYRAELMFPRAGTFTIDLFGSIEGRSLSERFVTGDNGLDKVISRGRQYPHGSGYVVLFTFGLYVVGVLYLLIRAGLKRRRAHGPTTIAS